MSQAAHGPADSDKGIGLINLAYRCTIPSTIKRPISPKSVLVYLALRYNEDRKYAWVSIGNIAHHCSMSFTAVKAALRVLKDLKLIERELRDECVTKSRKTIINWNKVKDMAEGYMPQSKFAPSVPTPATVIAADEAVAATLDELGDVGAVSEDKYAMTDEIIELLRSHFSEHPTFLLPDGHNMMKKYVRACIDKAGSGEECRGILTWNLSDDNTLKATAKSQKLGGYIQKSFPGWVTRCAENNRAAFGYFIDHLMRHDEGCKFSKQHAWVIPTFRQWLTEEVGEYLISVEVKDADDADDLVMLVSVSETFKAARILSGHTEQKVNPAALFDREDLCVAQVAAFAVTDEVLGEQLKNAPDAEEFFLDNFRELHQAYLTQRNEDEYFEPDLPEPSEEYVS